VLVTYPSTLTEAMSALTAAGWRPTLERQTSEDGPDFPDDLDISYISVALDGSPEPHLPTTGRVVEIYVSTCDCPEDTEQDEAAHLGGAVAGNDGPPARGFMVVYMDTDGVDEVAEDHVDSAELDAYARFWLRDEVGGFRPDGTEPTPAEMEGGRK
jgi:hypothetical protein